MTEFQHTLHKEYRFSGKGLHTGSSGHVRLAPAPVGTGIVFIRTDLGDARIPALAENVGQTLRSTALRSGDAAVMTAEHLLAALYALGVDNALVFTDREEIPILDGSAAPYVEAILADGLDEQPEERKYITIVAPVEYEDPQSGSRIEVTPSDSFSIEVTVDYNHPFFGVQTAAWSQGDDFASQIASCRTFCFLQEVEYLRSQGLIKGGDLDNAVVVAPDSYMCNPPLRFPNECARHKLLDVIGDFALLGAPAKVAIKAYKSGHKINTTVAAILRDEIH